jgi:hypothetical protein
MKERGRYQIQFMKTRSSSGVGQKVDLEFDLDTLRIRDLAEDPEYQQFSKQRSTIYDDLKKKSTTNHQQPAYKPDANDVPDKPGKVNAKVEGAKLRQLIDDMKFDEE